MKRFPFQNIELIFQNGLSQADFRMHFFLPLASPLYTAYNFIYDRRICVECYGLSKEIIEMLNAWNRWMSFKWEKRSGKTCTQNSQLKRYSRECDKCERYVMHEAVIFNQKSMDKNENKNNSTQHTPTVHRHCSGLWYCLWPV